MQPVNVRCFTYLTVFCSDLEFWQNRQEIGKNMCLTAYTIALATISGGEHDREHDEEVAKCGYVSVIGA